MERRLRGFCPRHFDKLNTTLRSGRIIYADFIHEFFEIFDFDFLIEIPSVAH